MKKNLLIVGIIAAVAIIAIILLKPNPDPTPPEPPKPCDNPPCEEPLLDSDSLVTSFVFVGCNRLNSGDYTFGESSANANVLKNIFEHVVASSIKTDYFFFLGDIVNGEKKIKQLDSELNAWNNDYDSGKFSDFKSSGIQLVAVPGNHEMLTYDNQSGTEIPLSKATETWVKYMRKFMPKNRDSITGSTSAVDRMTYSFTHGDIAFIVLNTDTYNSGGEESQFPYEWVIKQVEKYNGDSLIKHIFVMGHRPFYTKCFNYAKDPAFHCPTDSPNKCVRNTAHSGINDSTESNPVWRSFQDNKVESMLSAHVHDYQRLQPDHKTYQIVAGNGGSAQVGNKPPSFFGYTRINIYASGRVEMISEGYDAPNPYNSVVDHPSWSKLPKDSLFDMRWYRKGADNSAECTCVSGE